MKKGEFKAAVFELLGQEIDATTFEEKMTYMESLMIEYQRDYEELRDLCNKGKEWTDEELKIILSDAPSKSNCLKYAKIFHRGYGSIEQIYRWSTTQDQDVKRKRPDDKFVLQIKRIAKELSLRG